MLSFVPIAGKLFMVCSGRGGGKERIFMALVMTVSLVWFSLRPLVNFETCLYIHPSVCSETHLLGVLK